MYRATRFEGETSELRSVRFSTFSNLNRHRAFAVGQSKCQSQGAKISRGGAAESKTKPANDTRK